MRRLPNPQQLSLALVDYADPVAGTVPDLLSYHNIVVSSSGGKDSQTTLDYVMEWAEQVGYPREDVVVLHADLGRVEWPGSSELAEAQAAHYDGIRFECVTRMGGKGTGRGKLYEKGETFGDILDYAKRRGKWPGHPGIRWCTSEFKRAPIKKFYTALEREWRERFRVELEREWRKKGGKGVYRLLECIGFRREESPQRAKMEQFAHRSQRSTKKRTVDRWLPILEWTEAQVWDRIRRSGVPHHWAYDIGMPRLSCVFCPWAPAGALQIAGAYNPKLLDEYIEIEDAIGFTFKPDLSLRDVRKSLKGGKKPQPISSWAD